MDLNKFEKIDGREVLRRLANGEKIIRETGSPYFISDEGRFVCDNAAICRPHVTDLTLNEILKECDWYIPKPFDVRQAMRNKPDEWVGAFKNPDGYWLKVGFSTKRYVVLMASIHYSLTVGFAARETENYTPTSDELDRCIPIKDVPKDAY